MGNNESSLVTTLQTSCYLIEKGYNILEEKNNILIYLTISRVSPNAWKLSSNILKQRSSACA